MMVHTCDAQTMTVLYSDWTFDLYCILRFSLRIKASSCDGINVYDFSRYFIEVLANEI